ncbi:MAG: phosphoribosyltransferase [bacterium]|nr:phosphoribosyltransferase [bacterium]
MPDNLYYTWKQFDKDVRKLIRLLQQRGSKFNGVWGPARGGLPLAVCLSHALEIPLLAKPFEGNTLVVDDIVDTGDTLYGFFKSEYLIISIFYHRQSSFEPWIWLREKKDKYIVFPWEYAPNKRG